MNSFTALKKPSKPGESWNSPCCKGQILEESSPTPDFPQFSPNISVHRRAYTKESFLLKDTLNHLTKENERLLDRVAQLEKLRSEHKSNEEQLKSKLLHMENILNEKDRQIKDLKTQINQVSTDSVSNALSDFRTKLEKNLQALQKSTDEYLEIRYEDLSINLEGDISAIQEEGNLPGLRTSYLNPLDLKLSDYNKSKENSLFMNSFVTETEVSEMEIESLPVNCESYYNELKKKDEEILRHKNFIKELKKSLEKILKEHHQSKKENELHKKEILELKYKLGLTIPRPKKQC